MAETSPYPGSPSLSSEARDKVLQTFRHTLELARSARNEEALLGCDFIMKMDARFQPARRLLEVLRGVAPGTLVDLSPFELLGGAVAVAEVSTPAAAAPAPSAPVAVRPAAPSAAAPSPPPAPAAPVPFAAPVPAGLDDLAFDDFDTERPAAAPPAAAAPRPPVQPAPTAPGRKLDELGFGELPDLGAPPSFGAPSINTPAIDSPVFDTPAFDPPSLDAPAFGAPPHETSREAAPSPGGSAFDPPAQDGAAPSAPAEGFDAPRATPIPSPGVSAAPVAADPRVTQFLKQGDEAMGRGRVQEAIDLWSRVFLIDLSNEEASRRIDSARESQAEIGRRIDILLSEGIQLFDAGDLASARHKFLDVLAVSETDATARSYLTQIESSFAAQGPSTDAVSDPFGRSPDYMKDELEPTRSSAFASDEDMGFGSASSEGKESPSGFLQDQLESHELAEHLEPAAQRKGNVDIRIVLAAGVLLLAAIGGGAYYFLAKGSSRPAPASSTVARPQPPAQPASESPAPEGGHAVAQAQLLFEQGKVEEARTILSAIPDSDPRYPEALALIEKLKTTAPPSVAVRNQNAASLDELRISGLVAVKASRFIDAVKALDPVVKARPEDTESVQGLRKAREQVSAMGSAVRAFNEQDYESAIKLLWALRKSDPKNQDVEEFLSKSYFDDAIQNLQAGNTGKATQSFQEAVQIRPNDTEAQRHLKFCRKYSKGMTDLVSRIYVKHLTPRP